jgi:hypothetical protein
MPLFLANLAMASYFLALCYMLATVVTFTKVHELRRALRLHARGGGWSTVQLLILSVALGCLFRMATFSTLCIFDSQSNGESTGGLNAVYDGDPRRVVRGDGERGDEEEKDLDFYNKVVAVLFNLPDFLFVSSYLLLVLVWAEAFQSVR